MFFFKSIYLFGISAFLQFAATAESEEKYTNKYDGVNLPEILNNKRLLGTYIDCLLDRGRCTNEGMALKEIIPDALTNKCSKCSEKQKKGTRIVFKHLFDKEPALFKELEEKYDPNGSYRKRYKDLAEAEGFSL